MSAAPPHVRAMTSTLSIVLRRQYRQLYKRTNHAGAVLPCRLLYDILPLSILSVWTPVI
jgi:hypothetical protein